MNFQEILPKDIEQNVFSLIGADWMLITAGNKEKFNTMTASWGGLGVLWNKNVATCYIRPQRYTKEFMDQNDRFTLSFFGEEYRDTLTFCGVKSGREVNKIAEAGLTPVYGSQGGIYFEEANLVLVCRKLYTDVIKPENFAVPSIDAHYPVGDYHHIYIGEIEAVLKK